MICLENRTQELRSNLPKKKEEKEETQKGGVEKKTKRVLGEQLCKQHEWNGRKKSTDTEKTQKKIFFFNGQVSY